MIFYIIADGGYARMGGTPLPKWIAGRTTQAVDAARPLWGNPLAGKWH
ncbi:MAG: hypothetical protein WCE68_09165 [Anaerolineales bacterium]